MMDAVVKSIRGVGIEVFVELVLDDGRRASIIDTIHTKSGKMLMSVKTGQVLSGETLASLGVKSP